MLTASLVDYVVHHNIPKAVAELMETITPAKQALWAGSSPRVWANETFALVPQNQQAQDFSHLNGKTVTVEGVIPEGKKGTKPDTISVHSITGA
jgi:hypothetical protein